MSFRDIGLRPAPRFDVLVWSPGGDPVASDAVAARLRPLGVTAVKRFGGGRDEIVGECFRQRADAVVVMSSAAEDVCALTALSLNVHWDLEALSARPDKTDVVAGPAFEAALRRVDTVSGASRELIHLVEDRLLVGLPATDLGEALIARSGRTAVVVGSGLGNMLNVTPMLRWLSETLGRRLTLYVSSPFPQAVSLFAGSPFVDFVYPDMSWSAGRHYARLISTTTAYHLEPFCTADRWIRQNKLYDFNLHGRFVPEAMLNFFGLEEVAPPPRSEAQMPPPFVRDTAYRRPQRNRIGIVNGLKDGIWAKRQWPRVAELAGRLTAAGHEVVTFGLPEEYVPGTVDATGLSIRDTVARMEECRLFVGHDGGMIHLADAIGIPSLWLFGPTAIVKNGPMRSYARIMRVPEACGPCNFRLDWFACADPVCMSAITPDEVARAAGEMLGEIPLDLAARVVDEGLIRDEMRANDLDETRPASLVRRLQLTSHLVPQRAALVAQLIRFGDIEGARSHVAGMLVERPGSVLFQALAAALDRMLARESEALAADVVLQSVGDLVSLGLSLQEARILLECLTYLLVADGDLTTAAAVLRRALETTSGSLRNWSLRQYFKVLLLSEEGAEKARSFEARGLLVDDDKLVERLNRHLADLDPAELEAARLPLARRGAGTPAGGDEIATSLGRAVGGTVLVVCPSCDPMLKRPGYSGSAVHRLCRVLAAHGAATYVVSMTSLFSHQSPTLRDSVRVLGGSYGWRRDAWARLVETFDPALIIDIDEAAPRFLGDLAPAAARISVRTRGLWSTYGLAIALGDELQIGRAPPAPTPEAAARPGLDDLLARLPPALVPGDGGGASGNRKVMLLVNSPDMLLLARYVVRRLPQLRFSVASDIAWRGIEPNVECFLRRQRVDWKRVAGDCGTIVQLSPEAADTAVESWGFLEQGKGCVVASRTAEAFGAVVPTDVASGEAWVEAIRCALAPPSS